MLVTPLSGRELYERLTEAFQKRAKYVPARMPRRLANYSELTPEETAARDAEWEELIARSRVLSRKTI